MVFNQTSAILHSIEEELAKLALEVDVMESKIALRKSPSVSEGESDYEDADTVVSLSGSECGSMGSFEEFVRCSLPPVDPKLSNQSCTPFRLAGYSESSGKAFTQIPRSNKTVAQADPLLKKSSWKIGVEDFDSFGSSSKSDDTAGSGKLAGQCRGAPKASSIEVPKIVQRILAKASKLPKPPRSNVMAHKHAARVEHVCTLGTSQLPKPPSVRREVHAK